MLYAIFKKSLLTDENSITELESKFSTFFEEFKNTGISMWVFYILYIIRRTLLLLSYIFIKDTKLQLAIGITLSLSVMIIQVPLYVISFRSFKSIGKIIFHFCNEIIIAGFYFLILFSELSGDKIMDEFEANVCIIFITTSWAMNITFSSIETVLQIINRIRDYLNNRRQEKLSKQKNNKVSPANEISMETLGNISYSFN